MSTKTQSCFLWRDSCGGRKADQLACWVLSRPLPLPNIKLVLFKPAFHYQCSHTHQTNLFTKTCINKQFWMFRNSSIQKKQEQQRLLFVYPSWKGAWTWMMKETSEQMHKSLQKVVLMVFGQQQLLRVAAQASLAKQDQRSLTSAADVASGSFSLNQPRVQPDLETSSPFSTQATQVVNHPPKTHWIDRWSVTFPFLFPVRLSSSFPTLTSLM